MKNVAVTLALIMGLVATTFLGFLTWDAFSEEDGTTNWLDYQACIETVTLEQLDIFFDATIGYPETGLLERVQEEGPLLDFVRTSSRAKSTEACAELRPPLSTDE